MRHDVRMRTQQGKLRSLWGKYVWHGRDVAANVTALIEALVVIVAVLVGLLGAIGLFEIDTDLFRSIALFVAAVILTGLLVEAGERRHEADERQSLEGEVFQVPAHLVGPRIEQLLRESSSWSFRGGSGRWLREATLPALSQIRHHDVPMSLQLLDPRDERLCVEYARYRARQRDPANVRRDEDDPRNIQADLLASICAAAWYASTSRVQPEVVLLRAFSPLRYDVGTNGLFVTVANRSAPGLFARTDSWYYRSIRDELAQARYGLPLVILPKNPDVFPKARSDVRAATAKAALIKMEVQEATREPVALLSEFAAPPELDFDLIARRMFLHHAI